MPGALDDDQLTARRKHGHLGYRPRGANVIASDHGHVGGGQLGDLTKEIWPFDPVSPRRQRGSRHLRVYGMQRGYGSLDSAAGCFIHAVPVAVVLNSRGSERVDVHDAIRERDRIGEGEVRAERMADHAPTGMAELAAHGFEVRKKSFDLVWPMARRSATAPRIHERDNS